MTIHKNNDVLLCPVGMAGSQTIDSLTACVTNDQNLRMECKFTSVKQIDTTCTYEIDKKVVATNNSNKVVDSAYKNRSKIEFNGTVCVLTLTGFADDIPKTYNCIIQQDKPVTKEMTVDKSKIYIYIHGP